MSIKIIQERLDGLACGSLQEEEMALREITQELTLHSLYDAGFFKYAAFHGGTCLRIFHSLQRFSEDLDFALHAPNPEFDLGPYLTAVAISLKAYGYEIVIDDRSKTDATVRKAFLKDTSLGKILRLSHSSQDGPAKTLRVKLEIDTLPPDDAVLENKFHDFPLDFAVTAHNDASLFAGKSHALLCRTFIKGRDWYDFLWYVARKTPINFAMLSAAIEQTGPWRGKKVSTDLAWYRTEMEKRIRSIDWELAKKDVQRFLKPTDVKALEFWSAELFLSKLEKIA